MKNVRTIMSVVAATGLLLLAFAFSTGSMAGTSISNQSPGATSNNPAYYECNLSGNSNGTLSAGALPPCAHNAGGGTNTSSTAVTSNSDDITCGPGIYCGTRSDAPLAVAPINAHNTCYWIDNSSTQAVFVPFKSSSEWGSFLSNLPSGVTKTPCALPGYYVDGGTTHTSGDTVSVTPYSNSNCSSKTINIPTVYGRAGSPMGAWPTPALSPSFTCNNGGTTIQSLLQWTANYQSDQRYWAEKFNFSPNLTLIATDISVNPNVSGISITITSGDQVRLTWTNSAGSSTPSPSNNWNGANNAVVKPTVDTTYTLSSTSGGLTSVATVTVKVSAPIAGVCGSDANQTLMSTPTNLCGANNTVSSFPVANGGGNGWTWACTPTAGGTATNCSASLASAACGSNVQTDGSGNFTSGSPCATGTAGGVNNSGSYNCTTGSGAVTNTKSCTATITTPPTPTCTLGYNSGFPVPVPAGQYQGNCTGGCSNQPGNVTGFNGTYYVCMCHFTQNFNWSYGAGASACTSAGGIYTPGSNGMGSCLLPYSSSDSYGLCHTNVNCGSAAGVGVAMAPTTGLCSDGSTPSVTQGATNWQWTCGSNACTAPIVACDSAHYANGFDVVIEASSDNAPTCVTEHIDDQYGYGAAPNPGMTIYPTLNSLGGSDYSVVNTDWLHIDCYDPCTSPPPPLQHPNTVIQKFQATSYCFDYYDTVIPAQGGGGSCWDGGSDTKGYTLRYNPPANAVACGPLANSGQTVSATTTTGLCNNSTPSVPWKNSGVPWQWTCTGGVSNQIVIYCMQ